MKLKGIEQAISRLNFDENKIKQALEQGGIIADLIKMQIFYE